MINVSEQELDYFLQDCSVKKFPKKTLLSCPDTIPNEIFFVNKGILRVVVSDRDGLEHTVHFGVENEFVADYSSYLQRAPSLYALQALEDMEVVVLPRAALERGYQALREGDKLGRLVAENYFIYHDNRIRDRYCRTPKERYDLMSSIFPNIHNRVPQHMIASYIGITSVHLSRLKKSARAKT